VTVGARLIGEEQRAARADVGVRVADAALIMWGEIVSDRERGAVEFEN
jgi:hypothetical protein